MPLGDLVDDFNCVTPEPDGVTTLFTFNEGPYIPDILELAGEYFYVRGVDWNPVDPNVGTLEFTTAPPEGIAIELASELPYHVNETPDGVITEFSILNNVSYNSGKLVVYLNAVKQTRGTDWNEVSPGTGSFEFTTPPASGSVILVYEELPEIINYKTHITLTRTLEDIDSASNLTDSNDLMLKIAQSNPNLSVAASGLTADVIAYTPTDISTSYDGNVNFENWDGTIPSSLDNIDGLTITEFETFSDLHKQDITDYDFANLSKYAGMLTYNGVPIQNAVVTCTMVSSELTGGVENLTYTTTSITGYYGKFMLFPILNGTWTITMTRPGCNTIYQGYVATTGSGAYGPFAFTSSESFTDYAAFISIDTATLVTAGSMQADGSDIVLCVMRDGELTAIPFYIADINTDHTKIYFSLADYTDSDSHVYLFYGNPDATALTQDSSLLTDYTNGGVDIAGILDATDTLSSFYNPVFLVGDDGKITGTGLTLNGYDLVMTADIDTTGATSGQSLVFDGTDWGPFTIPVHDRKHDLDGTDDHSGITGVESNFMGIDANGLPKDSGSKAADFESAGSAATAVSGHESTYNHANYDTAYGWGDHASAGYFVKSTDDLDDITEGTTNKHFTATEQTKLSGIEAGADVTDATNVAAAGAVMASTLTTKGDILGFGSAVARIPVGTDGQVLTADSTVDKGLKWNSIASGYEVESWTFSVPTNIFLETTDKAIQFITTGYSCTVYLPFPGKLNQIFIIKRAGPDSFSPLSIKVNSSLVAVCFPGQMAGFIWDETTTTWIPLDPSSIGVGISGFSTGFGYLSTAYTYGSALGYSANGANYGAALGYSANGSSSGVAIGYSADSSSSGVALGYSANGSSSGVAIGREADGRNNGIALGYNANTNNISYATAIAAYSKCQRYGEIVKTANSSTTNSYLMNIAQWYASTSNNTPIEIFLNNSSSRYYLLNNSCVNFHIQATARDNTSGDCAAYEITGAIKRGANAASTALVGTPTITVLGEDDATWDIAVSADTTNGSLKITVTGDDTNATRWHVRGDMSEVRF